MPPFLKRESAPPSEFKGVKQEKEEDEKMSPSRQSSRSRSIVNSAAPAPATNPDVALIPAGWNFAVVIPDRFAPGPGPGSGSAPSASVASMSAAAPSTPLSRADRLTARAQTPNVAPAVVPAKIEEQAKVEPAGPTTSVLPVASSRGTQALIKARDSETPSTDAASRGGSVVSDRPFRGYKMTFEEAARLKKDQPEMFRLLFWRRNFQNCDKKLREQGADSLTMEDLTMLKQGLDRLAYIKFEEDALEWVDKTGILSALRLLTNRANFDDDTVEMATTLRQRWMEKNFNPGPISSKEEESASESESEAENIQPVSFGAFSQSLMHGILRYRNARGHMTMKLDPRGLKRRADVFGHNGLTVGDWWPYQLCALRDGAHGSKQGGIAGRAHSGAFSIVVSAESEYGNEDSGDRLSYLGTQHIGPEGTTMLTNATKSLIMSIRTGNPVRVIRRGPSPTSRIYPSCGFRYDGLYTVTARTPVRARRDSPGEHDFYKFTLVRNAGQPPLSNARNRPTPAEYTAYHRLTNSA